MREEGSGERVNANLCDDSCGRHAGKADVAREEGGEAG